MDWPSKNNFSYNPTTAEQIPLLGFASSPQDRLTYALKKARVSLTGVRNDISHWDTAWSFLK